MRRRWVVVFAASLAAASGCRREQRTLREPPAAAARAGGVRVSELQPGPKLPAVQTVGAYEGNAFGISEGERLYNWYNCVGCHFHGGGGIGPPLMDDIWVYGSDPGQVFASIAEGRPNGMPAFGGRIPAYQGWQIVAYVRSLSGLEPKSATAPRDDHLQRTSGQPR